MESVQGFYPKFVAVPIVRKRSTTVYLGDQVVTIQVPQGIMQELIAVCTGELTLQEVVANLPAWDQDAVVAFLRELIQAGIVGNSHNLSVQNWDVVQNPTRYFKELPDREILALVEKAHQHHQRRVHFDYAFDIPSTPFLSIVEQRRSTRRFSEELIAPQDIVSMLWAAYGVVPDALHIERQDPQRIKVWQSHRYARHTVPSAGALYPLSVHLCMFRPSGQLSAGIYEAHFRSSRQVLCTKISDDPNSVVRAFVDHLVMNSAQGVIVLSGNFRQTAEKYTNRAMLYVPLEAGHAAQNVHLAAAERNVQTLELGGFLEVPMQRALRLPRERVPLITILFGKEASINSSNQVDIENLDVQWSSKVKRNYQLPFSMVFARLKGRTSAPWSCGRSRDPREALLKARSETYEWNACSNVPSNLLEAQYTDLEDAIDPRTIIAYHERQYLRKGFPFAPLSLTTQYKWVEGKSYISGSRKFLLADATFFPFTPGYAPYTYANSSGCSAHPDLEEAIHRGVLELVERDAFMVHWLNRLVPPTISHRSLPEEIQKRIHDLQRLGFRVVVKDCTLDLTPVPFVFAQSAALYFTTCAAASHWSLEHALDHALMEVESAIHSRIDQLGAKAIAPCDVHHTDDHGAVYEQKRYFRNANHFGERTRLTDFSSVMLRHRDWNWDRLVEVLQKKEHEIVSVSLQSLDPALKVLRVFVPGLVPITFGYGVEPKGMSRLLTVPRELGILRTSLPYGKLQSFPHPYT